MAVWAAAVSSHIFAVDGATLHECTVLHTNHLLHLTRSFVQNLMLRSHVITEWKLCNDCLVITSEVRHVARSRNVLQVRSDDNAVLSTVNPNVLRRVGNADVNESG